MKILQAEADFFHVEGQMGRQTDMTALIVVFGNFTRTYAPENCSHYAHFW